MIYLQVEKERGEILYANLASLRAGSDSCLRRSRSQLPSYSLPPFRQLFICIYTAMSLTMHVLGCGTMGVAVLSGASLSLCSCLSEAAGL